MIKSISLLGFVITVFGFVPLSQAECFQLSKREAAWSPDSDRLCITEGYGGWNVSIDTGLPTLGLSGVGTKATQVAQFFLDRLKHPECTDCNRDEFGISPNELGLPFPSTSVKFDGSKVSPDFLESGTVWIGTEKFFYRSHRPPKAPQSKQEACLRLSKDGVGWKATRPNACKLIPGVSAKASSCYQLSSDGEDWQSPTATMCLDSTVKGKRSYLRFKSPGTKNHEHSFAVKRKKLRSCRNCVRTRFTLAGSTRSVIRNWSVRLDGILEPGAKTQSGTVHLGKRKFYYRSQP